ncbi:ATP-dependent DNA helicase RRM3-like [Helianthus annuus]|uniref:ATP-dependent DNA helicase RRM3-like n=1 Tax=Helianthus annuus TaxID=4232 RepID=UPI000B8FAE3D|nr:ATP-dependent DNA helicase RRM3-like [Helianthus annuus]
MWEFFAYRIQDRISGYSLVLNGRRLFQQFLVDAYTMVESERLNFIRGKQKNLRSETFENLQKYKHTGQENLSNTGQKVILPSSFTGGARFMQQNYLDAMALCKWFGYPDFFITITCNPKWPEISRFLKDTSIKPEDRPDILCRLFKMKLDSMIKDLKDNKFFGEMNAVVYTVEFQKRGLPHAHICLFMKVDHKLPTVDHIDPFISAEIPDKSEDPQLYTLVSEYMIHGPCGNANLSCPCMVDKRCSKRFPKKFSTQTIIDSSGFPVYRRRDCGRTVIKKGVQLDNRSVVPYNKSLLRRYQTHINVEWCNQAGSIKYLFKYINKGPDRATAVVFCEAEGSSIQKPKDEIKEYYDCRYISACEASWRILSNEVHYRYPAVMRLPFHLPGQHNVVYGADDDIEDVLSKPSVASSMFLKWYQTVGRIHSVSIASGEPYYLRILLNKVRGPKSFEDIRTVNGELFPTFKDACYAMGLLDDDNEYVEAIKEASFDGHCRYLRALFATMLLTNTLTRPEFVWDKTWHLLGDDILYRHLTLPEDQLKNQILFEIENYLISNGSSLSKFTTMPYPDHHSLRQITNRLINDELSQDTNELQTEFCRMKECLTEEQSNVFNEIMHAIDSQNGGLFFVYGYGGTGKTFLWKTLASAIRSKGQIVLNVASSGIASLLLSKGRTAHSRFKIPINLTEDSMCHIKPNDDVADQLKEAKLIIWDEAPMVHKHAFEALDRTMKDVLSSSMGHQSELPFGGKVIVFGGDFRQILPVIPNGTRQQIVNASLSSSYIWSECKVLKLTKNMRLTVGAQTSNVESIEKFARWLLDIGEGNVGSENDGEALIEIPDDLAITDSDDPIQKKEYLSSDSICQTEQVLDSFQQDLYSADNLNALKIAGLPNHRLVLKVGVPVMLLRNIDQQSGLCNGTRLQITFLGKRVIEAEVISGGNIGTRVYIPRISMIPSDKKIPFQFQRRQFPLSVCFAMTINKSQGQSLSRVGLYLKDPVFSHGQLYVALSRVKTREGVKILAYDADGKPSKQTSNVVYKEIFGNL